MNDSGHKRKSGEYGGVFVRVIFAIVTLTVIAVIIAVALSSAGKRQEDNQRKAVRISEYGLQEALTMVQENPSWTAGFPQTACDGGFYTVSTQSSSRGDTQFLTLRSQGTMARVSDVKECLLRRVRGSADSLWSPGSLH
jgi:hypothetical protein